MSWFTDISQVSTITVKVKQGDLTGRLTLSLLQVGLSHTAVAKVGTSDLWFEINQGKTTRTIDITDDVWFSDNCGSRKFTHSQPLRDEIPPEIQQPFQPARQVYQALLHKFTKPTSNFEIETTTVIHKSLYVTNKPKGLHPAFHQAIMAKLDPRHVLYLCRVLNLPLDKVPAPLRTKVVCTVI